MSSVFSKIISGDISCYKVAEDEYNLAFLDINPIREGHTLVIPKKNIDYVFDLDNDSYMSLWFFAKKTADIIYKKIKCKRVAIVVLGLEVPHAHIHLIPIDSEKDLDFNKERLSFSDFDFKNTVRLLSK